MKRERTARAFAQRLLIFSEKQTIWGAVYATGLHGNVCVASTLVPFSLCKRCLSVTALLFLSLELARAIQPHQAPNPEIKAQPCCFPM